LLFIGYKNLESIFIAQLLSTIITFTVSLYFLKFEFISIKFNQSKQIIKKIYSIGFFVYLIWAIDILFRTADRWFISQFYTLEELATYGFVSSLAMNIWLLSMSFFAPYAQMLYKYVAENNYSEVKNVVVLTNKKIYVLLGVISVVAIIAYPFLLKFIVHKYFGTWLLFIILVITSVFLSINNMFIYYMICSGFHFILLKYQVMILVINVILNSMFAYFHLNIVYFGFSTILSLVIYFILVRQYFYYDIEKKLKVTD
jgi:O-antigen/teichoic acid export membrane protein